MFAGEERILVPSPKVATYDLKPEMSAAEITDRLLAVLDRFDAIVVNYANADMVGHSGLIEPTVKAIETVDACLGRLAAAVVRAGGTLLITADHGNAEQMTDPVTGQPHTGPHHQPGSPGAGEPAPLGQSRVARQAGRRGADAAGPHGAEAARGDDGTVAPDCGRCACAGLTLQSS